jgi:hypothetical protein
VCAYATFGIAYGRAALALEPGLQPAIRAIALISLGFLCAALMLASLMWTIDA